MKNMTKSNNYVIGIRLTNNTFHALCAIIVLNTKGIERILKRIEKLVPG